MSQSPTPPARPEGEILHIPEEVASRLKYYVYLYVDPRDGRVFYVGKGKGQRALSHLSDPTAGEKTGLIRELRDAGLSPRLEVLAHGLE
jgi:hypothetical protein